MAWRYVWGFIVAQVRNNDLGNWLQQMACIRLNSLKTLHSWRMKSACNIHYYYYSYLSVFRLLRSSIYESMLHC